MAASPSRRPADGPGGAAPRSARSPQGDLFAWSTPSEERERGLLAQLISATRLYDTEAAIRELLAFTVRLREFAPFNGMLLHIQKPGLTHAATAADWWLRFRNAPRAGARPLLVLRATGPVDFVFDILDVEGGNLPEAAFSFPTLGDLSATRFKEILAKVVRQGITITPLKDGDGSAGWIQRTWTSATRTGRHLYQIGLNANHAEPVRFTTLAHELAHLFLGHLGEDRGRGVPDRSDRAKAQRECEAEMAAWIVASRNGIKPRSEAYLASYKGGFDGLDLHGVTRAANAIETCLGLASHQLVLPQP